MARTERRRQPVVGAFGEPDLLKQGPVGSKLVDHLGVNARVRLGYFSVVQRGGHGRALLIELHADSLRMHHTGNPDLAHIVGNELKVVAYALAKVRILPEVNDP